jgi:hypothetical protein
MNLASGITGCVIMMILLVLYPWLPGVSGKSFPEKHDAVSRSHKKASSGRKLKKKYGFKDSLPIPLCLAPSIKRD